MGIFCVFTFSLCVSLGWYESLIGSTESAQRWASSFKPVHGLCLPIEECSSILEWCLLAGTHTPAPARKLVSGCVLVDGRTLQPARLVSGCLLWGRTLRRLRSWFRLCLLASAPQPARLVSGCAYWRAHSTGSKLVSGCSAAPLWPSFCSRSVPLRSDDSWVLRLASLLIMRCAFTVFFALWSPWGLRVTTCICNGIF